ncbi:MAG: flavin reductase family protein [Cyclobacteriaceae bacterium]|jgi:flavin reductase (DIM6/NTAB) family NADH-FMN oxidoreductase RutF|nr:flavin reductase family protein [Cyclobacteriaceae bacterium]
MTALKKKPWNRVDQPVYSIASAAGDRSNMNICSYVTPVSMHPKRYMVAIYKNTFTLELVKENPQFVLQFLDQSHSKLVNLLGKKSGKKTDKLKRLANDMNFLGPFPYLKSALAIVHLDVVHWLDGGDHWCVLCDVITSKNLNDGIPLTLNYLKEKKIILS